MQEKGAALKYLLILASFIEGGCLMAFEVLSIKIYTPFLGASIYVWTAILAVTLAGLAAGYRIGGKLAQKRPERSLVISFLAAGLLIFLSTFIAGIFLPLFMNTEIRLASLLSGLLILFFPVFFMGTISPLIVKLMDRYYSHLGRSAGLIFGTGTIGGIVFILLTVYFLIPVAGITISTFLTGGMLILTGSALQAYKIPLLSEKK
jgi:predicted membrane-bound spermidine synthase